MNKTKLGSVSTANQAEIKELLDGIGGYHDPIQLARKVYRIADLWFQDVVKPHAVCSNGCGHCCKIPVEVSLAEAYYIHTMTGVEINELEKANIRLPDEAKTACPFLKNNSCSIYEFRPYHCRVFATLDDVKFCISDEEHEVVNYTANDVTLYLYETLHEASKQSDGKYAPFADIRDWFTDEAVKPLKDGVLIPVSVLNHA